MGGRDIDEEGNNFMWFLKYENNPTATFMVEM
jgi:hypothetical protein